MAGAAMHWKGGVYSGPNLRGVAASVARTEVDGELYGAVVRNGEVISPRVRKQEAMDRYHPATADSLFPELDTAADTWRREMGDKGGSSSDRGQVTVTVESGGMKVSFRTPRGSNIQSEVNKRFGHLKKYGEPVVRVKG